MGASCVSSTADLHHGHLCWFWTLEGGVGGVKPAAAVIWPK